MDIKAIVGQMTLEEKVSLLSGLDFWHTKSVDRLGVSGVTVSDAAELDAFLAETPIDIGVICTQKEDAQEIAEKLVKNNVHAIWNFAPIDVHVENASVENVHLSDSLYVLSYRLTNA